MPKVLIDGNLVDVPADALFADDGQTPFAQQAPATPVAAPALSEEAIAQITQQVAGELDSRLEGVNSRLEDLSGTVGSLTAAEQREKARLEQEQAALEAEQRRQEEEGLSAQELVARARAEWDNTLTQKEQEWNTRFTEQEQARQQAEALAQKEREFANLREYIAGQVEANKETIAPQLLQYIGGNTQEEVDASVARAVQTTNDILAEIQAANGGQQVDPAQVVVPQVPQQQVAAPQQAFVTRAAAGPGNFDPTGLGQQTLTPEQIANMPMSEYANLRSRMGIGGQGQNRGLFG